MSSEQQPVQRLHPLETQTDPVIDRGLQGLTVADIRTAAGTIHSAYTHARKAVSGTPPEWHINPKDVQEISALSKEQLADSLIPPRLKRWARTVMLGAELAGLGAPAFAPAVLNQPLPPEVNDMQVYVAANTFPELTIVPPDSQEQEPLPTATAVPNYQSINIRRRPTINSSIEQTARAGSELTVYGVLPVDAFDWYYLGPDTGWVREDVVRLGAEESLLPDLSFVANIPLTTAEGKQTPATLLAMDGVNLAQVDHLLTLARQANLLPPATFEQGTLGLLRASADADAFIFIQQTDVSRPDGGINEQGSIIILQTPTDQQPATMAFFGPGQVHALIQAYDLSLDGTPRFLANSTPEDILRFGDNVLFDWEQAARDIRNGISQEQAITDALIYTPGLPNVAFTRPDDAVLQIGSQSFPVTANEAGIRHAIVDYDASIDVAQRLSQEQLEQYDLTSGLEFAINGHSVIVGTDFPTNIVEFLDADVPRVREIMDFMGIAITNPSVVQIIRNPNGTGPAIIGAELGIDFVFDDAHQPTYTERNSSRIGIMFTRAPLVAEDGTHIYRVFLSDQEIRNFNEVRHFDFGDSGIIDVNIAKEIFQDVFFSAFLAAQNANGVHVFGVFDEIFEKDPINRRLAYHNTFTLALDPNFR